MAMGSSMKLLWQIMEKHRGRKCFYQDAEVVPDDRVVYLPIVRAEFLRVWPGSSNPNTRVATYGRVFKSMARAGGFTRLSRVPLQSFEATERSQPLILTVHGQDILIPTEEKSPFVELNSSPVMQAVQPKTAPTPETHYATPEPLRAISIYSTPTRMWAE